MLPKRPQIISGGQQKSQLRFFRKKQKLQINVTVKYNIELTQLEPNQQGL